MKAVDQWYDAHLEKFQKSAYPGSREEYQELYRRSIEDVDNFWAEQAKKYLSWDKEWDFVLRFDFHAGNIEWFGGAVLNACYNCLDRHLPDLKNRVAYYWEGDEPKEASVVTYAELYKRVNRFAAVLKSKGVVKGDRVIIYMPMIPELPVVMLACARIGAIHSVVFGGFSAESIANRIHDSGASAVVTVDGGYRGGRRIPYKQTVDEALKECPAVKTVIVFERCSLNIELDTNRETWWHEAEADPSLLYWFSVNWTNPVLV